MSLLPVFSQVIFYRKDVRLPVQLQRAMAAEAEAAREARAKVIAAEGEQKASRALREASEVIGDSPAALQLRYLQVMCCIYLGIQISSNLEDILGASIFSVSRHGFSRFSSIARYHTSLNG